jgi:hypothetical protein
MFELWIGYKSCEEEELVDVFDSYDEMMACVEEIELEEDEELFYWTFENGYIYL